MRDKYLETIILIGPCGSGKTTIGNLISQKTGVPFYNLDQYEPEYSEKVGFDLEKAEQIKKSGNLFTYYEYCRQFFGHAISEFLKEFPSSILELGGGHPIVPDFNKQEKIKELLSPYKNIFLLLPDPDLEKSLEILRGRNESKPEDDLNSLFFKDNSFFEMAKFIVYTENRTPEECVEEIIQHLIK